MFLLPACFWMLFSSEARITWVSIRCHQLVCSEALCRHGEVLLADFISTGDFIQQESESEFIYCPTKQGHLFATAARGQNNTKYKQYH